MARKKGTYVTKRGKTLDVSSILSRHQKEIAAGNANYNAKGDLIGRGGEIIKKAADKARAYYKDNPKSVKKVGISATQTPTKEAEEKAKLEELREVPKSTNKTKTSNKKKTKKKAPDEIVKPDVGTKIKDNGEDND
jgi:hypothetical protein